MRSGNSTYLKIQCKNISKERLDQVRYNLFQCGFYNLKME